MLKLKATLAATTAPTPDGCALTFDFEGEISAEALVTIFRDWVNKIPAPPQDNTDAIAQRLLADAALISAGADRIAVIAATLNDVS
jgi:hypothetical protein